MCEDEDEDGLEDELQGEGDESPPNESEQGKCEHVSDPLFKIKDYFYPDCLERYVGQEKIKNCLKPILQKASALKPMPHMLLVGPPQAGKKALAYAIAQEVGSKIHFYQVTADMTHPYMCGVMTNLQNSDILFMNNIHCMPFSVVQSFNTTIETFKLEIVIDEGDRPIEINLPKFTVIAATDKLAFLDSPMAEYYPMVMRLEAYNQTEQNSIYDVMCDTMCARIGIKWERDALFEIVKRSDGTPENVACLLERIAPLANIGKSKSITSSVVNYYFQQEAMT
jgi:Holliday junction DNA helicase RuvB